MRLRPRLPAPAMVVAVAALVVATTGSAVAANHYLITSTKQISPKTLRALKGKAGVVGKVGPEGPAGVPGTQGSPGTAGSPGAKGDAGANGTNGIDGAKGDTGATGGLDPTQPVPSGKTITGRVIARNQVNTPGDVTAFGEINFPTPLPVSLPAAALFDGAARTTACSGSSTNPTAAAGNVCIYVKPFNGLTVNNVFDDLDGTSYRASRWGVEIIVHQSVSNLAYAVGTWAATAP